MKTMNEINAMIAANVEDYRKTAQTLRANVETLRACYRERIEDTPAETVRDLIAKIGYEPALEVVMTLVNMKAWDGRISRDVKTAGADCCHAWDRDAAFKMWVDGDAVHPAHLDQIARELIAYVPEEETEGEETEEEETEEITAEERETVMLRELRRAMKARSNRSAWDRGVSKYIAELIDELEEHFGYEDINVICNRRLVERALLNGASCWEQYSEGGCSLIMDTAIARRLCTPSELRRTDYGLKNPNASENWLQVQARALYQAAAWVADRYLTYYDNIMTGGLEILCF